MIINTRATAEHQWGRSARILYFDQLFRSAKILYSHQQGFSSISKDSLLYYGTEESWSLLALRTHFAEPILPSSSTKTNNTKSRNRHTVLGNVAGLAAVVTGLGHLVGSKRALLGDVAALAARVALDRTRLAVLGKVVRTAALVTGGALGELAQLLVSRRSWSSTLVLRALSRDVAELRAVVALGALGAVWAVASDVANVTAQVALLGLGGLWLRARRRLVAGLATVVAQSLLLLAVVGDVAGLTTFVTRSWEHFSSG